MDGWYIFEIENATPKMYPKPKSMYAEIIIRPSGNFKLLFQHNIHMGNTVSHKVKAHCVQAIITMWIAKIHFLMKTALAFLGNSCTTRKNYIQEYQTFWRRFLLFAAAPCAKQKAVFELSQRCWVAEQLPVNLSHRNDTTHTFRKSTRLSKKKLFHYTEKLR